MKIWSWSYREMLEVQFRKNIRQGWATNAVMAPVYAPGRVPEGESVVVAVMNKSVGIPFTETGFLAFGHGFVRYEEIEEVQWICPDFDEAIRMKATHWDQVWLKLKDGSCLTLEGLGPSFDAVWKFLNWVVERRKSELSSAASSFGAES